VSRVLIDSNIFVYAFDRADPDKRAKALRLIEEVTLKDDLVLSAAARHHRLSTIYTEDFQHDRLH